MQLGAKVVTMSDSTGWIYDAEGLDLDAVKEIKEVKRARLSEYKTIVPMPNTTRARAYGPLSATWLCPALPRTS